jgi:hypothetical protein
MHWPSQWAFENKLKGRKSRDAKMVKDHYYYFFFLAGFRETNQSSWVVIFETGR